MKPSRIALMSALLLAASNAMALDTSEPLAHGLVDTELYFSSIGMGNKAEHRTLDQTLVLGAGLPSALNIFGIFGMGSDGDLKNGYHTYSVKLTHGTVDTEHFDLDLWLATQMNQALTITPGFEINIDAKDALKQFGFFTKMNFPIYALDDQTTFDVIALPGIYYTFKPKHQLLAGVSMTYSKDGEDNFRAGTAHLSYNFSVIPQTEFIADFGVRIPKGNDEDVSFEATIGLVGFLPQIK